MNPELEKLLIHYRLAGKLRDISIVGGYIRSCQVMVSDGYFLIHSTTDTMSIFSTTYSVDDATGGGGDCRDVSVDTIIKVLTAEINKKN
jgi:hypothetical protein